MFGPLLLLLLHFHDSQPLPSLLSIRLSPPALY
jgi:hypothetical protein